MEVSIFFLNTGQQSRGINRVRKSRTEAADKGVYSLTKKGGCSLVKVAGMKAGAHHQSGC